MKSLLELDEFVEAVKGKILFKKSDFCFTNVATDSRNIKKDGLFVPLMGEVQNGHKYIPQAIQNGASVVLITKKEYKQNKIKYNQMFLQYAGVIFIQVKNTLHALQNAAERFVENHKDVTKISITGSCGKTTTKEMLVAVFKAKYGDRVSYTEGNFNSETGLPLSVFKMSDNAQIGIYEMGMNRVNEIGEISKVLKSNYGIITNIGTAHIGILGSQKNIAKEKRKSFDYITENGAVFVPYDDKFSDFCTKNVKGQIIKYGTGVGVEDSGVEFIENLGLRGSKFSVDGLEITLPISGKYNYINALGVIACARKLGVEKYYIKKGLESLNKIDGRMEIQEAILKNSSKVTLVKDCYNANPDSMGKMIDFISELDGVGKKIFVLADMKELGDKSVEAHAFIGNKLEKSKADLIFLIGPEMKAANSQLSLGKKVVYYPEQSEQTIKNIAEKIISCATGNDVIAFKGSHSMEVEKVIPEVVKNV